MASPVCIRSGFLSLWRSFIPPSSALVSRSQNVCSTFRFPVPSTLFTSFHSSTISSTAISTSDEPDSLIQKLSVLVKGHDRAVLDSYEFFATTAARELNINVSKVSEPPKEIERFTLLKSIHIFKKHRVQYETRTHYRHLELIHLTGSTAQVYLEYIQRNLPEGVAMEVTKTIMEKVPDHILQPLWTEDPLTPPPATGPAPPANDPATDSTPSQ